MIRLTNNISSMHKIIPLEKIFDAEIIDTFSISKIRWLMRISSKTRNVSEYCSNKVRIDEIDVFCIRIESMPEEGDYERVLKQFHQRIPYPCVAFLEYKGKYKITTWKFTNDTRTMKHKALQSSYISSWIYIPQLSEKTRNCFENVIELLLHGEGNLNDIYNKISAEILNCCIHHVNSRKHLYEIIYYITGNRQDPLVEQIDCEKYYNYYRDGTRGRLVCIMYEYEDIWATLMNNEKTRAYVNARGYSDIDRLIYDIESHYEDLVIESRRQFREWNDFQARNFSDEGNDD